jgi:hypothetical protein
MFFHEAWELLFFCFSGFCTEKTVLHTRTVFSPKTSEFEGKSSISILFYFLQNLTTRNHRGRVLRINSYVSP